MGKLLSPQAGKSFSFFHIFMPKNSREVKTSSRMYKKLKCLPSSGAI